MNFNKVFERIKNKVSFFWITVIFAALMAIMLAGYIRVVLPASQSETFVLNNLPVREKIDIDEIGKEVTIIIKETEGTIDRLEIPVFTLDEQRNSRLKVSVGTDDEELGSGYIRFNDKKREKVTVNLDKEIYVDRDTKIYVTLTDEGEYIPGTGALGKAWWNVPQTDAVIHGEVQNFDLAVGISGGESGFVSVIFWGMAVILILLYIVLCFGLFIKNWKPEQIFVVLGLGFGILYSVIWGPYSCPDEYAHISTVYYYSSVLLNEPAADENGNTIVRAEDLRFTPSESHTRKYSYKLYEDWNIKSSSSEMVSLDRGPLSGISAVSYLPQIIAVSLIRLLGLNNIILLIGGRILSLVFYIVIGYFAIRYIPFGKRAMMILMLGVSSVQQAASFSYDCMLNSCAFLFAGYVLYLIYEKDKTGIKDWILLFVLSLIFTPIKVVYVVMTFAVFLIGNNKISISKWKAYMVKAALVISNMAAIVVMRTANIVRLSSTPVSVVNSEVVQGYDLITILKNPLKVIVLWANTLRVKPVDYLRHMFGGVDSANGVPISWTIIMGFFILLALGLIVEKNEKLIDVKGKVFGVAVSVIIVAMLFLIFTLDVACTDLSSQFIMGIQGRYFFPFLPLLFPAMQSKFIVAEKSIIRQLSVGIYAMQFLAICSILETVVAR